jgi:hypothetical protein
VRGASYVKLSMTRTGGSFSLTRNRFARIRWKGSAGCVANVVYHRDVCISTAILSPRASFHGRGRHAEKSQPREQERARGEHRELRTLPLKIVVRRLCILLVELPRDGCGSARERSRSLALRGIRDLNHCESSEVTCTSIATVMSRLARGCG